LHRNNEVSSKGRQEVIQGTPCSGYRWGGRKAARGVFLTRRKEIMARKEKRENAGKKRRKKTLDHERDLAGQPYASSGTQIP
jgi:hypothetical protein